MVRNLSDNDIAILLSSGSCSESSKQDLSVTGKRCKKRLDYKTMAGGKNTSKHNAEPVLKKCNSSIKNDPKTKIDLKETSAASNSGSSKPKGKKLVNFIENKENQQRIGSKNLRKKDRVDYLSMFRGSSLLPTENSPEKAELEKSKTGKLNKSHNLDKSKNQTLNKTKDQTLNKTCIYRQIEEDDDEPIRPSQVFEFSFDPQQETKMKVEAKKKAKILKKIIHEKAVTNKIKTEVLVMKKPEVVLPRLTFGDHLLFKTPKAKEIKKVVDFSTENEPRVVLQRLTFNANLLAKPQSTPNQKDVPAVADTEQIEEQNDGQANQDDLGDCRGNSYILNPEISEIFTPNQKEIPAVVDTEQIEEQNDGQSNQDDLGDFRGNSYILNPEISEIFTPNQKEIPAVVVTEQIEEQNDGQSNQDDLGDPTVRNSYILNPEISEICDNFDDIMNDSVTTNNTTNNQSIPWRIDVPNIPKLNVSNTLTSNTSTNCPKTSFNLTAGTDCSLFQSNIKQTSISNYLNQEKSSKTRPNSDRKTVHFNNEICLKSPAVRSSISSLNSSRSGSDTSISDISHGGKNCSDENIERRSSVRSCSDTSISDVSQGEKSCSDENIERYSNKKSLLRKMNFNAAVTSSPSTKILGDKNVFHKKSSLKQPDGCKKSDRVRFTEAEKENRVTNFGFDVSTNELIEKRKSKKPIRISTTDLNKVLKRPNQIQQVDLVDTINDTDVTEPTEDTEATENYSADLDDTEPTDQQFVNNIFEEPRFTHLIRRSYSRYDHMGTKRKKAVLESSDEQIESIEEHVPKKVRKNKNKDKEDLEFEKWASQFNSVCDEVDKEELIVETSVNE